MKKIIEETGLKIADFAQEFSIPYNTVRQWYNGERKCPTYILNMIRELTELRKKGEQLTLFKEEKLLLVAGNTPMKFINNIKEKDENIYSTRHGTLVNKVFICREIK